jgi:OOP family OmpA-OmpF porin
LCKQHTENYFLKNIILTSFFLFLCSLKTKAQADEYTKNPAIGISYCLFNFKSADYIRKNSLSAAFKDGQVFNSANMISGLAISYLNGIRPHFDFSVSLAGTFTDYTLYNGTKLGTGVLLMEGDVTIIGKMFTDKHLVSPYFVAGLGLSGYSNYYGLLIPVGLGAQLNFSNIAYLLLNAEYKVGVTANVNSHFYFSIGVAGNIKKRKPKQIAKTAIIPLKDSNKVRDKESIQDTDGDGIPDSLDKCPLQPGIVKYNGCPVPDTDGDGISDEDDSCVLVKGVLRYHGCPVPDRDGDGINDEDDKCPLLAGPTSNRGCPVVSDTLVKRLAYIAGNIYFKTGQYKLLPASYKALNELILILKENPLTGLSIEGHTDNVGSADKNLILSENRASAVKTYLELKGGISEQRLTAEGFGLTKPIADNKNAAGRAMNRRVELKLKY